MSTFDNHSIRSSSSCRWLVVAAQHVSEAEHETCRLGAHAASARRVEDKR